MPQSQPDFAAQRADAMCQKPTFVGTHCVCNKYKASFKIAAYVGVSMSVLLDELIGWWKPESAWHEFDSAPLENPFGLTPNGSLIFTRDRRMLLVVARDDLVAPLEGSYTEAHSGRFVLVGSEIVTTVDFSSKWEWKNKELRYSASLGQNGDLLFLTSRQAGLRYRGAPFTFASRWCRLP